MTRPSLIGVQLLLAALLACSPCRAESLPQLRFGKSVLQESNGGRGGFSTPFACPPGQAIIGLDYTAGYLIYGLRFHCGQLEVVTSERERSGGAVRVQVSPGAQSELYGNLVIPPPEEHSLFCAGDDQVITQVESFATRYQGTGPFINELSVTCSRVSIVKEDGSYRVDIVPVGPPKLIGNFDPNAQGVVNNCGNHGVVTQFNGRAGAYIDSVAFACSELSVEPPASITHDERFLGFSSALILIAAFVLLSNWARTSGTFLRWFPPLLMGGGGLAVFLLKYFTDAIKISQGYFALTLSCVGLLVLMTGAVNGRAFRQLSQIEPFSSLAPIALRSPRLRRRVFAPYVSQLAKAMATTDGDASTGNRDVLQGMYIPLPADIESSGGIRTVSDPREELGALIFGDMGRAGAQTDEQDAIKILIEGPGGRGKSTLLNTLLLDAITQFNSGASSRIPVLCSPQNMPWERILGEALGPHRFADNILATQLEAGDFALFADGLSESEARASDLAAFIRSIPGAATPMIMACRPRAEYRRAVRGSSNWWLATPQPLEADSEALRSFVTEYHALDECELPVEDVLSLVNRICRGSDKKYSPILVRLTIRACVNGEAAESIASVYESAFRQLVCGSAVDANAQAEYLRLRQAAVRFACGSYWQSVSRAHPFSGAAADLERLRSSGVLIGPTAPYQFGEAIGITVRFFHDSLQSYFAGVGLVQALNRTPARIDDALLWMAGSPQYRNHRSDLFGYVGSELFCMVAHIAPPTLIQQATSKALRRWAETLDGKLARDDVAEALPEHLKGLLNVASDGISGGAHLQRVLSEAARRLSDEMQLTVFEALYAKLAVLAFDNGSYTKPELELDDQIKFKAAP